MSPKRIALIVVVGLAAVLIGANAYYRHVQSPVWEEQTLAETQAVEKGHLKETLDSHKYVWDETVWIVEGIDADGDDAYVWLKDGKDGQDGQSLVRKRKDGASEDAVKAQFLQAKPDADIDRLKLGMKDGEPVWELFYSREQSGRTHYYYDFYRFGDGSYWITYSLPKQ